MSIRRIVYPVSRLHSATALRVSARAYSTPKPALSSEPLPAPRPVYPPATNPFAPTAHSVPANEPAQPVSQHSPLKISIVKALAKFMGYNSRSVTAIRETGNMCGSIVRAVERDHDFWYEECQLAPTYQTFFQLHLLYLFLLLPRLRSLSTPASITPNSVPSSQTYQTEILTHFFALAENQMRMTLGEGERERVVKGYMKEMGEQWKGAGMGFDYALAVGQDLPEVGKLTSLGFESPSEGSTTSVLGGDAEMAAWVWRNLFAGRYSELAVTTDSPVNKADSASSESINPIDQLKLSQQLSLIVSFIRREVARLDAISCEDVEQGRIGEFGRVREGQGRKGEISGEESTVDGA